MIDLSLASLKQGYISGEFTPEDVLRQVHQRIAETVSHNIWINVLDDVSAYLANLKATKPEELPLWGVPFAIKDNIDLEGCPTTAACPDYAYMPDESATVVGRLIAAGAIPVGKTNLDQFATGLVGTRSPHGAVQNAINPDYISGGSSSGSAVAVKLGMCSFSLGTDTAGSGRIPAGFNELVGLKPSLGWLSTKGVIPACKTLDCVSIFAGSVSETRLVASCCAGPDDDPWSRDIEFSGFDIKAARIGKLDDAHLTACDDESRQAYKRYIASLASTTNHETTQFDFAPFAKTAQLLYEGPWLAERYAAIEAFISECADSLHPVTFDIISQGIKPTAVDAFNGEYALKELRQIAEGILEEFDVMVVPTAPKPFTIDEVLQNPIETNSLLGTYCNLVNLLDLCAIAIPAGTLSTGMPFGVTLIARAGRDHALLDLASSLCAEEGLPTAPRPGEFHLAVCGAHLSGQPLNPALLELGGYLVEATQTSDNYRLFALPDGKRPALVRDPSSQTAIEIEVWSVPDRNVAAFLRTVAPPLGIGQVELADGRWVGSFIAESVATDQAKEITRFGGWRAYKASQ